jgi:hypothetical protein
MSATSRQIDALVAGAAANRWPQGWEFTERLDPSVR